MGQNCNWLLIFTIHVHVTYWEVTTKRHTTVSWNTWFIRAYYTSQCLYNTHDARQNELKIRISVQGFSLLGISLCHIIQETTYILFYAHSISSPLWWFIYTYFTLLTDARVQQEKCTPVPHPRPSVSHDTLQLKLLRSEGKITTSKLTYIIWKRNGTRVCNTPSYRIATHVRHLNGCCYPTVSRASVHDTFKIFVSVSCMSLNLRLSTKPISTVKQFCFCEILFQ